MSFVPLPWWTSQSTIITRSRPERIERMPRRDRDVVEQAEAHRSRRQRVVAGRPVGAEAARRVASSSRSTSATAPPAACSAAPYEPARGNRVGVDHCRRRAPTARAIISTCEAGWTAVSVSTLDRGRLDAREPEPVAALELALDRDDPRRLLGVAAGVVLERRRVGKENRRAGHREYRIGPLVERPHPGSCRRRRRRRAVRRADRRPRGGAREPDLGDAAGRLLELLGSGRPRRRARRRTTVRSFTCRTRSPPGAAWCASRRRASSCAEAPAARSRT